MADAVNAAARPDDPSWLKIAFSHLGLKEVPGARDNPTIVEMFARIGRADIRDDETSWCAAFVGSCLLEAGVPLAALPPKDQRLLARSYLGFGRKVADPVRGAIVVLRRGSSAWQGHVAFFLGFVTSGGKRYVQVIGGNQSNAVTVARYPVDSVLGYRAPATVIPAEPPPKPAAPEVAPAKADSLATATGAAAVTVGAGGAAAAASGAPWWAVLAGLALGLIGLAALFLLLRKRG